MAKEYSKYSDITKADIAAWKKTKANLTEVEFDLDEMLDGKKAKFVICNPPRNILPSITEYGKQQNIDKINEVLIANCVLGGDMEYLDSEDGDTQVFLGVIEELGKRLEPRRSRSKKL